MGEEGSESSCARETRCFCYYGYSKHSTEGVKDVMLVEMISQQISRLIYNNTVAYWEGISMSTHQEGAKHIKANKVDDSKVAATVFTGMADLCPLLTWAVRRTGQHDFLPCLPCCTPTEMHKLNVRERHQTSERKRERKLEVDLPEEQQNSLRKRLKVVVSVDLAVVPQGNLTKHLWSQKNITHHQHVQVQVQELEQTWRHFLGEDEERA